MNFFRQEDLFQNEKMTCHEKISSKLVWLKRGDQTWNFFLPTKIMMLNLVIRVHIMDKPVNNNKNDNLHCTLAIVGSEAFSVQSKKINTLELCAPYINCLAGGEFLCIQYY